MFYWDDLRYLLAVARTGSTLAASRTMGVAQTTVARRIEALEAAVGLRLFDRGQNGSQLTEKGAALIATAEEVERAAQAVDALARAYQRGLAGALRVTTNESLAHLVVMPALPEFRRLYPDIRVEVNVADQLPDLTPGEADIAIRGLSLDPDRGLTGRKLFDSPWGFFCSDAYANSNGAPRQMGDLALHSVIGGEGELGDLDVMRWVEASVPLHMIHFRCHTLSNLAQAAVSGLGVALLPAPMAWVEETLVPCFTPPVVFPGAVWMLTSSELETPPRVRAFMDFFGPYAAARVNRYKDDADRRQGRGPVIQGQLS